MLLHEWEEFVVLFIYFWRARPTTSEILFNTGSFFWALIFLWSKAFTTVKINRIKAYFIEESSNEWKAFNIQFEALSMVKFIVGNDEQEVMTHDFYFTIEIYVPVESSN